MKKLMIMVAAVACTIAANAAVCTWSATNIKNRGTEVNASAGADTVYLFLTTDDITKAAVIAALSDTETTDSAKATWMSSNSIGTSKLTDAGKISGASASTATLAIGDNTFFGVIFEGNDVKGGAYYCITADKVYSWDNVADTAVGLQSQKSLTSTASNWKQVASNVPEPTSGILLILGVAGLALRRRRG